MGVGLKTSVQEVIPYILPHVPDERMGLFQKHSDKLNYYRTILNETTDEIHSLERSRDFYQRYEPSSPIKMLDYLYEYYMDRRYETLILQFLFLSENYPQGCVPLDV